MAASCAVWIATKGGYVELARLPIVGPLHGEWWRLFTCQFAYFAGFSSAVYLFAACSRWAIFGWLLERRHGPAGRAGAVLRRGRQRGAAGRGRLPAAAAERRQRGRPGAARGLGGARPAGRARERSYYDGDLLGTAAIAAVLLAMPLALREASWLAGVTGGAFGLVAGPRVEPRAGGMSSLAACCSGASRPWCVEVMSRTPQSPLQRRRGGRRDRGPGDPERLSHAQEVVTHAAPALQRILLQALHEGGWFGSAHAAEVQRVAGEADVQERLRAVDVLVAEQTRLGMFVGVTVGFQLARELSARVASRSDHRPTEEH